MNGQLPNVAIIGRPNVGKSALFNRLIGRKIAIVHDQPGVTRDRIAALCSRCEQPFMLSDTGGIAGAEKSDLAGDVQRVVRDAIQRSDVLIFVVDGKIGLSPADNEIARTLRKSGKPSVLAVNKIDNVKHENLATDFDSLGFGQSVSISAEHNRGISELLEAIDQLLPSRVISVEIKAQTADSSPARTKPLSVAIVGRPNVGKSSLINSIVRNKRAIVSELAGTTRDSIDISYERDGKQFIFIDTAGIRRRGRHSSSVEVFSVMRAERSIRRTDLCVLIVDLLAGITAQDKRIAGLIQKAGKPCLVILNKWDLVKPKRGERKTIADLLVHSRDRLFFLDYAPVLVASALTHENVERLFGLMEKIRAASRRRIGTGILNRGLRAAFAANPPPMRKARRLKLFYAAQAAGNKDRQIESPEFILFVNDPRLLIDYYQRYLAAKIREIEPYTGLPIILTLRPRGESKA